MLPRIKQKIIELYTKELNNFIIKFMKLTNDEKTLRFSLLISKFNGHFVDKGINWKSSSVCKRFFIDITILEKRSYLNPDLFRVIIDDDNYIKLIDKTFGKMIDNLITLLTYLIDDYNYSNFIDDLILSIEK